MMHRAIYMQQWSSSLQARLQASWSTLDIQ
nr:MAG TPA: hypothetical protein [Caudoviricetes sp.]